MEQTNQQKSNFLSIKSNAEKLINQYNNVKIKK